MENYISGKKASEILGVHQRTLMNWDRKGLIDVIRTPGNKRLYNVKKYLEKNKFKCDNSNLVKGCDFIIDEITNEIYKRDKGWFFSYIRNTDECFFVQLS